MLTFFWDGQHIMIKMDIRKEMMLLKTTLDSFNREKGRDWKYYKYILFYKKSTILDGTKKTAVELTKNMQP